MNRSCDLRLGDEITASVYDSTSCSRREVVGTAVQITGLYVHLALAGGEHVLVGKHTEVKSVRAPQTVEEIEEWLDRPVIPCYRCG